MCHTYLKNLLTLPQRYEKVEKFYIELLKNKNKDLKELKKKYDLEDSENTPIDDTIPFELPRLPDLSLNDHSIEQIEKPVKSTQQSSINPAKVAPIKLKTLPVRQRVVKVTALPSINKPKLLNPTILPKIESKSRLDLLSCDKCSHTTSTKFALAKHLETHLKHEKLYECKFCNKKFSRKPILISHEMTHKLSSERKTFQCMECGKHLSSQTAVNTHIKWRHESRELKCLLCTKEFATVRSFFQVKIDQFLILNNFLERISQGTLENSLRSKATYVSDL